VQGGLWALALLLDMGGPFLFGSRGWKLEPAHFAERHGLVIIIALGESLVALGVASQVGVDAEVIRAAVLGVALAAGMWWLYFDVGSLLAARALAAAPPGQIQNELGRDAYSYLHFPMVAGIVLIAVGIEHALLHLHDPLDEVGAAALVGGLVAYVAGLVGFKLRSTGTLSHTRLVLGVAVGLCTPIALQAEAWVTLFVVTALVWATVAYETHRYREQRAEARQDVH